MPVLRPLFSESFRIVVWGFVILGLVGCASPVPKSISEPASPYTVSDVRQSPSQTRGVMVRWGGTIVSVDNRERETWLEIVAHPLEQSGRPKETDATLGRFLARATGFLEPAVYAPGREITVYGMVEGLNEGMIGDYPYEFPVIGAHKLWLWEKRPERASDPRLYDPWYRWPHYGYPAYWYPYPPYYGW